MLAFTACQSEEDDLFDSSAAERLAASKITYTQRLPQATAGWAMEFYPTNASSGYRGQGYLMLAKFNTDKSVTIGMNNIMTDYEYKEDTSLWEVIADQGPVLSFNTYNQCLHYFADPAIYDTGLGFEGDYEFEIISLPENAEFAMLKGKKRSTYVRMTRLEEGTDFEEYLQEVQTFNNTVFPSTAPNKNVMAFSDKNYILSSAYTGFMNLYPEGEDSIITATDHAFLITKKGDDFYLRFRDAFSLGEEDDKIQELVYDKENDSFRGVENSQYIIHGANPYIFFSNALCDGHRWQLSRSSDMSESMAAIFEEMFNGFKAYNRNFALQNVIFSQIVKESSEDFGKLQVDINYRNSGRAAHVIFYYDIAAEQGIITISNRQPQGTAETVMDRINGIEQFLTAIEGSFSAIPAASAFNLSTINLISANDAKLSFVLKYM